MFRSAPFVDRLSIPYSGNVTNNAICLGDCDNDGCFELCVGNSQGDLSIFRGLNEEPWKKYSNLGHIVTVSCGDLLNRGRNVISVISADGHFRIFDLQQEQQQYESAVESSSGSKASSHSEEAGVSKTIKPCFYQRLPPNIKQAQIADVNGDGLNELIVTLTDRVIRTYQWRSFSKSIDSIGYQGELAALAKWEFGRQIGGSGLLVSNPQQPILYVTQLGGEIHKLNLMDPLNMPQKLETINPISDIRSTPEIVCSLRLQTKDKSLQARIAVASEDSIYYIVDDKLQWKIHLGENLFGLGKLAFNDGNCDDEVLVSSSWEGQTYIVDQKGSSAVIFTLDQEISAFSSGFYSVGNKKMPVLVYATFTGMIYLYYNISDYHGKFSAMV